MEDQQEDKLMNTILKKRAANFYNLLFQGCGKANCENKYCASNSSNKPLDSNEASCRAEEYANNETICSFCSGETSLLYFFFEQTDPVSGDIANANLMVSQIFERSAKDFSHFFLLDGDQNILAIDLFLIKSIYKRISNWDTLGNTLYEGLESNLLNFQTTSPRLPSDLGKYIVLLMNPLLFDHEYHVEILPAIVQNINNLSAPMKEILVEFWSSLSVSDFKHTLSIFQQFITFRLISNQTPTFSANSDSPVTSAAVCLSLLHQANLKSEIVDFGEFTNSVLSERLDLRVDFPAWKNGDGFSFCHYPFLLTAAFKSEVLKIENIVQMRHEMQDAFFRSIMNGPHDPYLVLQIRRDHLIRDALIQLSCKPHIDLKKQLRVQFIGEEGVDEGGIRKEFFQLIVREIFDPKYGMFSFDPDTQLCWFSENAKWQDEREFELIGLILGLAIYNSVILDVHFPIVVYKKLMGCELHIHDLRQSHRELWKGLKDLLAFEGDVAEVYARHFEIEEVSFDKRITVPLTPNGENIPLKNDNRKEYVKLYVNYVLNKSIEKEFEALKRGFQNVASGGALNLFRAEEVESLICGCPDIDFVALEKNTKYDGGFSIESLVIINFWRVVHTFNDEQKKKLLFFATGSDRVPIGGLSRLQFVIAKNGPDSNRLPSAHTCFNVLLLPEYSNKEKLETALLCALQNTEGFGLI